MSNILHSYNIYLKPCPCCGSANIGYSDERDDQGDYSFVMCNQCGLCASAVDTDPVDPVVAWNNRIGSCQHPQPVDLNPEDDEYQQRLIRQFIVDVRRAMNS